MLSRTLPQAGAYKLIMPILEQKDRICQLPILLRENIKVLFSEGCKHNADSLVPYNIAN